MAICEHPFDAVERVWNPKDATACAQCKVVLGPRDDYEKIREDLYKVQVGWPIVWRDFLGNEILIGSKVIYPTLSGRSCQMAEGVVVEINPPTKADPWGQNWNDRFDAPDRLKVLPTGRGSRWERSAWRGDVKPVTLSANAPSAVVVG